MDIDTLGYSREWRAQKARFDPSAHALTRSPSSLPPPPLFPPSLHLVRRVHTLAQSLPTDSLQVRSLSQPLSLYRADSAPPAPPRSHARSLGPRLAGAPHSLPPLLPLDDVLTRAPQATAFVARTVTAVVRVLPRRPAINDHVFTLLFAHLNDLATTMGSVGGVPVLDMHLLAWLIATVRSTPGGARLAYVKHAAWTTFDELLLSFTGTNINNMSATSAWRRREEVRDGLYDWLDKHPSVLPTLSDADNRRFARCVSPLSLSTLCST